MNWIERLTRDEEVRGWSGVGGGFIKGKWVRLVEEVVWEEGVGG